MMPGDSSLLRIFWPSDALTSTGPGVAVGWRNSDRDFFVVCVLENVEVKNVEGALRAGLLFRNSPHPVKTLLSLCGNPDVQVVASVNPQTRPLAFDSSSLSVFVDPHQPALQVFCPRDLGLSVQVILYTKPSSKQMQYLSLEPIPLALGSSRFVADVESDIGRQRLEMIQKLRLHTIHSHDSTQKDSVLALVLRQMNCSDELSSLMKHNASLIGARTRRKISVSERVVESATNAWTYILTLFWRLIMDYAWPIVTRSFKSGIFFHRIAAEIFLSIIEWKPRPSLGALRDISATAQQVDIRLQQFCYWPVQYATLRKRRDDWYSITDNHAEYIRFYNSLWLVANDVIIGIAFGSFILDNVDWVAHSLSSVLAGWTLQGLSGMIVWLTDWPAGLKLNNELASFLGDLFLWVMDYWSHCVEGLQPFLPHLIFFIGFSSFAGASMPIALLSDLLSILTVHIYSFYVASARIYHWQLTIIVSLFHLFRGKKHNVLRNRIDSCDYDLDQLLLGTILFTLLVFLLPTVIVFYFTFAFARVVIIALKAVLDTMLACLNHFPLFALMLKLKDPERLPGGICFDLKLSHVSPSDVMQEADFPETSCVALKSTSLSLTSMFHSYFELGRKLRQHYLSFSVILSLVTGQFVPPIRRKTMYSLQYSMLPTKRHTINEMWELLDDSRSNSSTANVVNKIPNGSYGRRVR